MSGIPSWAVKGARVVCVSDYWDSHLDAMDLPNPVRGEIYVIDSVDKDENATGGIGVYLVGFPEDAFYSLENFRPVKTIEDDISEHFAVYLKTPVRTSIRAGERA